MSSLLVSHISKRFKTSEGIKNALLDVSFEVSSGEVLCLLGLNGSGKTTLLKSVATLLDPDEGKVLLDGADLHRQGRDAKQRTGFASSEDHSFYGRLTVRQNLQFFAQLHGVVGGGWTRRLAEVSSDLDLEGILRRPFRELSSGQKQRVLLARAVLHDPSLLLLDEPHQNLDPRFATRLRRLISEKWSGAEGKIVIVSTHHLEDALKISDRWLVLSAGRVRFYGSVDEEKRKRSDFSVEKFFDELTAEEPARVF
jgi:ABC-type multidrug transport system ATPase subunit